MTTTKDSVSTLSVVIVNFHAWEKLKSCLHSLSPNNQHGVELEICVIDNDPADQQMDEFALQFPNVKFVKNSGNNGFAHGCNTGALKTQAQTILFLNPDTRVPKNGLAKMLEAFAELPPFSILATDKGKPNGKFERSNRFFPSLLTMSGIGKALHRQLNKNKIKSEFSREKPLIFPDWVSGCVVMIDRQNFLQLNGWDTRFWMYSEDADLCKRATVTGGQIALMQNLCIEHDHGTSSRINAVTEALTKTEVKISHHVYVSIHHSGIVGWLMHLQLLVFDTLSTGLWALLSLLFFNHPKAVSKRLQFANLLRYYAHAVKSGSWLSPRSLGKETRFVATNPLNQYK